VSVTLVGIFSANNLEGFEHTLLGLLRRLIDGRRKKKTIHQPPAIILHKKPGQFLRGKSDSGEISIFPVSTVKTVSLTGIALQNLEESNASASFSYSRIDELKTLKFLLLFGKY